MNILFTASVVTAAFVGSSPSTEPAPATAAADVKGTVTFTGEGADKIDSTSDIVVWIEGAKEFEIPEKPVVIEQKNTQFVPSFAVVVAGQLVEMPNKDNIAHNAFSKSPTKPFNLGIYPKGTSKWVTFEKPGVVDVFCSMHRKMHATIIVVPSPHFGATKPDKPFEIKGVPAGAYLLRAWHKDCEEFEQRITIEEGGASDVTISLKTKESG